MKFVWIQMGSGWQASADRFTLRVVRSGGLAFEWRVYEQGGKFVASGTVPITAKYSDILSGSEALKLAKDAAQAAAEQEVERFLREESETLPQHQPEQRIYFDGCEGSGKTTLARETSRRYGLPLLTEVASAVLYEFQQRVGERAQSWDRIRADVELSSEVQARVFERQLADERALPPPAVYDRTLSCLAYAELYANNFAELLARVPSEYIENLQRSVVFLVRPQPALRGAADGVRAVVSWESQVRVDQTIETLLKIWGVRFVSVESLVAANREQLVDWCLEARGFKRVAK